MDKIHELALQQAIQETIDRIMEERNVDEKKAKQLLMGALYYRRVEEAMDEHISWLLNQEVRD